MRWTVSIEASGPGSYNLDWADGILAFPDMQGRGLAMSVGRQDVGFTFDVEAPDVAAAAQEGTRILRTLVPELEPFRVRAETVEEQERQMAESNVPELLGVSEVAEALGISRQRVSELAESADFPAPIVRLKAGPIWQRSSIARFVGRWPRRAGRPRRNPTSSSPS